jgi:hypothetical protein
MERFLYVETPASKEVLIPISKVRYMSASLEYPHLTHIETADASWAVNHSAAQIASAINRTPATNPLIRVTEKPLPQSSLEREV